MTDVELERRKEIDKGLRRISESALRLIEDNNFRPPCPPIQPIREIARAHGYAVGVHGSLVRDFDLIAVPWVEEHSDFGVLVTALCIGLDAQVIGKAEEKPCGRKSICLQIDGWYKHIDLSVMVDWVPAKDITPLPLRSTNLVQIHDWLLSLSCYPDSYPMEAMKDHLRRLQGDLSSLITKPESN